jgi:hypothetical protein
MPSKNATRRSPRCPRGSCFPMGPWLLISRLYFAYLTVTVDHWSATGSTSPPPNDCPYSCSSPDCTATGRRRNSKKSHPLRPPSPFSASQDPTATQALPRGQEIIASQVQVSKKGRVKARVFGQRHKALRSYKGLQTFFLYYLSVHANLTYTLATTTTENLSDNNKHYLVFDQIGHMAASTTYIHAIVPINISSITAQAQPLYQTFQALQKLKTNNLTHLPFCKNMHELGKLFEETVYCHKIHLYHNITKSNVFHSYQPS